MKSIVEKFLVILLTLVAVGCSAKKRTPMLLALGQVLDDSISTQKPNPKSDFNQTTNSDQNTSSEQNNSQPAHLPNVYFESTGSSVYRMYANKPGDTHVYDVTVVLSSPHTQTVTVEFTGSVISGPTLSNTHYSLPISNLLTFSPGEVSKTIPVTIYTETDIGCENYSQGGHTLRLILTNPAQVNLGSQTTHDLTIARNGGCE